MLETTDHGAVRVLALDRQDRMNAFNGPLFDALVDGLHQARDDASVRAVVITGKGRAFTAGADLSEMGQRTGYEPRHGFPGLVDTLLEYPKPVAAAVNGVGVGVGGTLCGLVDFVFVAESAGLRCPFAALGINPEAGSSYLFPLLMGWQRAHWFLLSAEYLDADQCVEAGLALRKFPDQAFLADVVGEMEKVARNAPSSLKETKALLRLAHGDALRRVIDAENEALKRMVGSAANQEAIRAFMEKRAPDFGAANGG